MYMYNVELLFNRHVTDIMIIIILHFLLSLYLWLHYEFRALVIRIYMYIVFACTRTLLPTRTMYLFCTSCPQCVLCQLAIIGRCGLYTSNSPSPSSYLCLHTVFCSHHPLSWPLMYILRPAHWVTSIFTSRPVCDIWLFAAKGVVVIDFNHVTVYLDKTACMGLTFYMY